MIKEYIDEETGEIIETEFEEIKKESIIKCTCGNEKISIPVWIDVNIVHNSGTVQFKNIAKDIADSQFIDNDDMLHAYCSVCKTTKLTNYKIGE